MIICLIFIIFFMVGNIHFYPIFILVTPYALNLNLSLNLILYLYLILMLRVNLNLIMVLIFWVLYLLMFIFILVTPYTYTSNFLYEVHVEAPSSPTMVPPTVQPPPTPELKPLPANLKYAYLEDKEKFPVIISASLDAEQEEKLLLVFKKHKKAIG